MSLEKDRGTKKEEPVLITINTFSERIQVSHAKAREISRRKDLCDAGISVNINAGKRGGIRIDWIRYLEYVKRFPAVDESRRTPEKKRFK
ncbi:MAG: hypothetical protein E7234_02055 [Lachnospiraceae bacterium]|jgi:hypothetical protein|nr:hypothetical protein [Lachnospiraceae bacterium]